MSGTNQHSYTFNRGNYFPSNVFFVGIMGIIVGILLIFLSQTQLIGVIILLLTSPLWITRKKITINLKAKTIHEYIQFLIFKFGETKSYNALIDIRIKTERMSQTMHARGGSSTVRYTLYSIVLQTDQNVYTLKSSKDADKMASQMEDLSKLFIINT